MRAIESFMNSRFIETYGDCVFIYYDEFQEFTKKCVVEFIKEFGEFYSSAEVSALENEAYASGRSDESEDSVDSYGGRSYDRVILSDYGDDIL